MKKFTKQFTKKILSTLIKDDSFNQAYQMACNYSEKMPYLVGGKLYRTIIEELYEYPARSQCCDIDFATGSVIKSSIKNRMLYRSAEEQAEDFGLTIDELMDSIYCGDTTKMWSEDVEGHDYAAGGGRHHLFNGNYMDLINIPKLLPIQEDAKDTIEYYLERVPLSVQSIAMDIENCEIIGDVGIASIRERYVWINNEDTLISRCKSKRQNHNLYIKNKAMSIKFNHCAKLEFTSNKKSCGYKTKLWNMPAAFQTNPFATTYGLQGGTVYTWNTAYNTITTNTQGL